MCKIGRPLLLRASFPQWKSSIRSRSMPDQIRERAAKNEIRRIGRSRDAIFWGFLRTILNSSRSSALAEQLDIPIGIHIGLSAPGVPVVHAANLQSSR
jgi:hypothetical protein